MSDPTNPPVEAQSTEPATSQGEGAEPRMIGVISDVHGNYTALQTVLDDMPAVDAIVHAGDTVGYGPRPDACTTALRERDVYAIQGNHDTALLNGQPYESGGAHAEEVLSDQNRSWFRSLPQTRHLFDGAIRVAHGHPDDQLQYVYPAEFNADLLNGEDILILGHTHVQAAEQFAAGWVLNPGSVGQPRDEDPRAGYATVDLAAGEVSLHRVSYDIDAVAERIRANSIADRNATRLYDGH